MLRETITNNDCDVCKLGTGMSMYTVTEKLVMDYNYDICKPGMSMVYVLHRCDSADG